MGGTKESDAYRRSEAEGTSGAAAMRAGVVEKREVIRVVVMGGGERSVFHLRGAEITRSIVFPLSQINPTLQCGRAPGGMHFYK